MTLEDITKPLSVVRVGPLGEAPGARGARLRSIGFAVLTWCWSAVSASHATAQEITVAVGPPGGPAGEEVVVHVTGMPPGTPAIVGFGGIASPHEILGDGSTDSAGGMVLTDTIPSWVEPGRTYLFYVAFSDQRPVAFSDPFLVTDQDGQVRVHGRITEEGVSCTAMRGSDDVLYTLTGSVASVSPGDEVAVVATVAEVSICMQGITLVVRELESAGSPE